MIQVPLWQWAIIGSAFLLLLSVIKFLASREVKRNDDLHLLVSDHIKKEEIVWVKIAEIAENTKDIDGRVVHLEHIANGNVAALTSAIGIMTKTLTDVLERRTSPRV